MPTADSGSMTRAYARRITRSFAPLLRCRARRTTHERQSGFRRERGGLLRRGTWLCGLLLSLDDSCAGGVSIALSAVAGYANVERFCEPVQGVLGDRAVTDRLFWVARSESGIRALEVFD